MEFQSFEPGIEINNTALAAIVAGFQLFPSVALRFLHEQGLIDEATQRKGALPQFAAEDWFSLQACLNVLRDIENTVGPSAIYSVGLQIPNHARHPPQLRTVHDYFSSVDVAFHMNHRRNGAVMFDPATGKMIEGIGHYHYTRKGERMVHIQCENPYSCEFDRGLLTSAASRFEARAKVVHDDGGPCRKKSGTSCHFTIAW